MISFKFKLDPNEAYRIDCPSDYNPTDTVGGNFIVLGFTPELDFKFNESCIDDFLKQGLKVCILTDPEINYDSYEHPNLSKTSWKDFNEEIAKKYNNHVFVVEWKKKTKKNIYLFKKIVVNAKISYCIFINDKNKKVSKKFNWKRMFFDFLGTFTTNIEFYLENEKIRYHISPVENEEKMGKLKFQYRTIIKDNKYYMAHELSDLENILEDLKDF